MSARAIGAGYPYFVDKNGHALDFGYVYIGTENLDPETNPINVYWDSALTIPALQPLRTMGGFIVRAGTPTEIYANSNYSIKIKDKKQETLFTNTSVASGDTLLRSDLASSAFDKGSTLVMYNPGTAGGLPRDVQSVLSDCIYLSDYVSDFTGSSDCSDGFKKAVIKAATTGKKLICKSGTILVNNVVISKTDAPNWKSIVIEGEVPVTGQALNGGNFYGFTIKTIGNSALKINYDAYSNEGVTISRVGFYNSGAKGSTTAIFLEKAADQVNYPRGLNLEQCGIKGFDSAITLSGLTPLIFNSFFGPTSIDRCSIYDCGYGILVKDTYFNLFSISRSLLHECSKGGIVFASGSVGTLGGGVLEISNTHLEGCEPAGIITAGRVTQINQHCMSSEGCGVVSGLGLYSLAAPASAIIVNEITITGNGVMPGTYEVPPLIPYGTSLRSTSPITVRSIGSMILTPDTVTLDPGSSYSYAFYPASSMSIAPSRSKAMFPYAGTTTGNIPISDSSINSSLLGPYSFCNTSYSLYDQRSSFGTVGSARVCVATFIGKFTSSDGLLAPHCVYTINGATTIISASISIYGGDLACMLIIAVPSGADLTRLSLVSQPMTYSTPAYVTMESSTGKSMSTWGHPPDRTREYVVSITNGSSYTFSEFGLIDSPYSISATLILDNGKYGVINYSIHGLTTAGSKVVDVVSGASTSASVVVTVAGGSHTDMYNISVANSVGATIKATLRVTYNN